MTFTEGPIHERSDVVVSSPIPAGQVRTASASRVALDAVVAAIVGLVLLVVGLLAIVRAGVKDGFTETVVDVVGFTHTNTLGIIEVAIGLALLSAGAARSRSGAMFFGTVLGVAGFVGAVQTESFATNLALETSMAWLAVIASVVVVLTAILMPRFARQTTSIERTYDK